MKNLALQVLLGISIIVVLIYLNDRRERVWIMWLAIVLAFSTVIIGGPPPAQVFDSEQNTLHHHN